MLAPFAPHLAEHLWEKPGREGSVHQQPWPTYDPALLSSTEVTVAVQVSGKRRGEITLAPDASEAEALEAEMAKRVNGRLRAAGILKGESKFDISTAHTEADVAETLAAFEAAIAPERRT